MKRNLTPNEAYHYAENLSVQWFNGSHKYAAAEILRLSPRSCALVSLYMARLLSPMESDVLATVISALTNAEIGQE